MRVLAELLPLAGPIVGEEDEATLVDVFQQHRTGAGAPLRIGRRDHHRVRLVQTAGRRLREPPVELPKRVRRQLLLAQPLRTILGTHPRGVEHT